MFTYDNAQVLKLIWSWYMSHCLVAYGGQCSVTCGEGQQMREVTCVGSGGERLPDHACSGLARPSSVQACRRPACHTHITWHVTDYGLVGELEQQRYLLSLLYVHILYALPSCVCSALEAAVVVWGRGEWAAMIRIWTPTQRPAVEQQADLFLWRHATHRPAPEHKVSQTWTASTVFFHGFYCLFLSNVLSL